MFQNYYKYSSIPTRPGSVGSGIDGVSL